MASVGQELGGTRLGSLAQDPSCSCSNGAAAGIVEDRSNWRLAGHPSLSLCLCNLGASSCGFSREADLRFPQHGSLRVDGLLS